MIDLQPSYKYLARSEIAKSLEQTPLIESRQRTIEAGTNTSIGGDMLFVPAALFALLGGTAVSAILVLGLLFKKRFYQNLDKVNVFHRLPCKNCRFFHQNFYLKCAIQPSKVLTKDALNCADYEPDKPTHQ